MARPIASSVFDWINKALGATGPAVGETVLEDSHVFQTLDMTNLARRGRTQGATQGIYCGLLRNIHSAADNESTSIEPYDVGVGVIAPWPNPIPTLFDLWLLAASVEQFTGSGTLLGTLFLRFAPTAQGFGVDDSGNAITKTVVMPLALWDGLQTQDAVRTFGVADGANPFQHIGLRIPRTPGTILQFATKSSALATFDCMLMFGLFPVALGQDVAI